MFSSWKHLSSTFPSHFIDPCFINSHLCILANTFKVVPSRSTIWCLFINQNMIAWFIITFMWSLMHNWSLRGKQGVTFPSPLNKHCPRCLKHHIYTFIHKIKKGYANLISSSSSHVASSAPKCFHCTLTYMMARFHNIVSLLSMMHWGSGWNYPSGSTCITVQSITWLESCTYFFNKDTVNTLWAITVGGKASLYATCPTLLRTSNGPH